MNSIIYFTPVFLVVLAGYTVAGDARANCSDGEWSSKDSKCVECGRMVESDGTAEGGEIPWNALVYDARTYLCQGTLVTSTMVISAASCFWGERQLRPASDFAVAVGMKHNRWNSKDDPEAQKSDVKEIIVPPRFQSYDTNLQSDIALVKLVNPIVFTMSVHPVCLDLDTEEDMLLDRYGKLAGWELASKPENLVLKTLDIPYRPIQECIEESSAVFLKYITSDKICAGDKNGTKLCRGILGSGLAFKSKKEDRYYLQGILIIPYTNTDVNSEIICQDYKFAVFTFVSKHKEFIAKHL